MEEKETESKIKKEVKRYEVRKRIKENKEEKNKKV